MACLYQHSWPGNIRELENVLEAAFYLGGSHLDAEDLPEPLRNTQGAAPVQATSLKDSLMQAERNALKIALAESGGSRIHAARILGISKSSFYQKLARHGLYVDAQPAV
ncbi:helix-turn-helix domain-containing protein [Modicisalibacter luteus]